GDEIEAGWRRDSDRAKVRLDQLMTEPGAKIDRRAAEKNYYSGHKEGVSELMASAAHPVMQEAARAESRGKHDRAERLRREAMTRMVNVQRLDANGVDPTKYARRGRVA